MGHDFQRELAEIPAEENAASEQATLKKKGRPDGADTERYKGLMKWSYRRWAWEFLRRNEKFKTACKQADANASNEEKAKIASEFGLRNYKSYTEAYKGKSGWPRFTAGQVTSFTHLNCDQDQDKRVRAALKPGQVLIRFDLSSALADIHVLERQLRIADVRLRMFLKSYAAKLKVDTQAKEHHVPTFGHYLRLLDARTAGKNYLEAGLMIAPNKARRLKDPREDITKKDLETATRKKTNRAVEYTTDLYRYLATRKGKPKAKSIPLEE